MVPEQESLQHSSFHALYSINMNNRPQDGQRCGQEATSINRSLLRLLASSGSDDGVDHSPAPSTQSIAGHLQLSQPQQNQLLLQTPQLALTVADALLVPTTAAVDPGPSSAAAMALRSAVLENNRSLGLFSSPLLQPRQQEQPQYYQLPPDVIRALLPQNQQRQPAEFRIDGSTNSIINNNFVWQLGVAPRNSNNGWELGGGSLLQERHGGDLTPELIASISSQLPSSTNTTVASMGWANPHPRALSLQARAASAAETAVPATALNTTSRSPLQEEALQLLLAASTMAIPSAARSTEPALPFHLALLIAQQQADALPNGVPPPPQAQLLQLSGVNTRLTATAAAAAEPGAMATASSAAPLTSTSQQQGDRAAEEASLSDSSVSNSSCGGMEDIAALPGATVDTYHGQCPQQTADGNSRSQADSFLSQKCRSSRCKKRGIGLITRENRGQDEAVAFAETKAGTDRLDGGHEARKATSMTTASAVPPDPPASTRKPRTKRKYNHESFAQKLHRIVTNLENSGRGHIMSLLDEGGLWVHKPDVFVEEVMPQYFRGTTWACFRRQLFSYRFPVQKDGPNKGAFCNPHFLRGRPELCATIERDDKYDKKSKSSREIEMAETMSTRANHAYLGEANEEFSD